MLGPFYRREAKCMGGQRPRPRPGPENIRDTLPQPCFAHSKLFWKLKLFSKNILPKTFIQTSHHIAMYVQCFAHRPPKDGRNPQYNTHPIVNIRVLRSPGLETSETHCRIYVSHIPNFAKTFPEIKIFSKNILPKTFFETSHRNVCPNLLTSGYQTYLGMLSSSLDRPREVASYSVAYP